MAWPSQKNIDNLQKDTIVRPHCFFTAMQLTIQDVVRFLNLDENKIQRMIRKGELPAHQIHGQYYFNRAEFLDWVMAHRQNLDGNFIQSETLGASTPLPQLSAALKAGGIHYALNGRDKKTALRALVAYLRLPTNVDRELVLSMILAREAMAATGIGDGIALPHARSPMIFAAMEAQIALGFLAKPVDFGALDGKPVQVLFSIIAPTVRVHLHLLSRLAFALQDETFRAVVLRQASADVIFHALEKVEAVLMARTAKKS